jgi:hypothetical protein
MRLTTRRLMTAGFATAIFSGVGLFTAAVAAEPAHIDRVSDAASLSGTEESLPGGDLTLPGVAFVVLLGSAGLAWVVRRSAPAHVAVVPAGDDDFAPTTDLTTPRQPAGTKPRVPSPAAA